AIQKDRCMQTDQILKRNVFHTGVNQQRYLDSTQHSCRECYRPQQYPSLSHTLLQIFTHTHTHTQTHTHTHTHTHTETHKHTHTPHTHTHPHTPHTHTHTHTPHTHHT